MLIRYATLDYFAALLPLCYADAMLLRRRYC